MIAALLVLALAPLHAFTAPRAARAATQLFAAPPIDGLAPPSQADLLREAVLNGSPATEFNAALDAYAARRRTH